ncbi:MAG TPA: sulfurtransferase [Acidimicrobiales bacterium]
MASRTALPGILVDAAWVAAHRDEIVLADIRWYLDGRDGRTAFEAGHIPGAVYVDLDSVLSAPEKGGTAGRHPLPTPEAFARDMGALGIGERDVVVAYDDAGGGTAGRLVVMLRLLGRDAALLDGGMRAWPAPLEQGPSAARPPVTVAALPWPADRLPTADDVAAAVASGVPVLDARAPERYRGEVEPIDANAGHVPGARNEPWATNLDPSTGRFLPVDVLRARFEELGARPDGQTIAYCGSGVSACMHVIALEHSGLGGRLFVPSWSGWSADPLRPVATGDR